MDCLFNINSKWTKYNTHHSNELGIGPIELSYESF
jgi:hypothetical protein